MTMSIDTAIARVGQILAAEQQLANPASAVATGPPTAGTTTAAPTSTAPSSFAGALATAQASAGGASASMPTSASGYVNPLANASVRPERVDQGVDYAGSGTLGAIGPGVVTQVVRTGSGWEGEGYVEYKLTAGPYAGRYVYYAEGVTPTVSVGQTLSAGQPVATIIPGAPHGIEIGWGSGVGESSYAQQSGGGYSEGALTAAGKAFSDLIASLGGPAGLTEGRSVTGKFS